MSVNPNEDTEFNDALRKYGILPPREPTPSSPSPPTSPTLEDILSNATPSELKEIEENENDSETERIIASYRQQRLAELRRAQKNAKFGRVYPISREDYTAQVTDASKISIPDAPEIKGTGVVCFLYKEGQAASTQLASQLEILAARHPRTKFFSIIGDKCIPNYADELCPTIIVYRGGEVTRQVVAWGSDRAKTIAELEAMLILSLAITSPPILMDSGKEATSDKGDESNDENPPRKNFRASVRDENSDSDFDL